jgi:hypothetical protein
VSLRDGAQDLAFPCARGCCENAEPGGRELQNGGMLLRREGTRVLNRGGDGFRRCLGHRLGAPFRGGKHFVLGLEDGACPVIAREADDVGRRLDAAEEPIEVRAVKQPLGGLGDGGAQGPLVQRGIGPG